MVANGKPTKETCPRCGGRMARLRNSISRTDNKTIVCSACGRFEGLLVLYGGTLPPVTEWPIRIEMR